MHFTNKAYLVKLSTKGGGGGQKSPKNGPHGLCMAPQGKTTTLWGFLDLKSELIRKGETENQGKNGQI